MLLSETRIVLFEKAGFKKNFYEMLDEIEIRINDSKGGNNKFVYIPKGWVKHKLIRNEIRINDSKGGNNKFVYIPKGWVKHKLIRKILEENRYKINSLSDTRLMYTDMEVSISWD